MCLVRWSYGLKLNSVIYIFWWPGKRASLYEKLLFRRGELSTRIDLEEEKKQKSGEDKWEET